MKRIYLTVASLAFTSFVAVAQETYENTKLIDNDLNGTARYVGMGGAMEALGADLSTIGTNPAGLGLFRKGKADLSFGLVNQTGMNKFNSLSKTNMSFDQIGVVFNLSKTPNAPCVMNHCIALQISPRLHCVSNAFFLWCSSSTMLCPLDYLN